MIGWPSVFPSVVRNCLLQPPPFAEDSNSLGHSEIRCTILPNGDFLPAPHLPHSLADGLNSLGRLKCDAELPAPYPLSPLL